MTGVEKVAVFLLTVGEATAAKILKHFDNSAVHMISSAMASMQRIDQRQAQAVVRDFLQQADKETGRSVNSFDYVRQMLDQAVGEREAARVMEYIMRGGSMAMTMEIMRETDPSVLAEQLRNERPQAIALVLAHLGSAAGSELLAKLPDELAREVLYRFARLDTLQPHVLHELGSMLQEQLSGQVGAQQLSDIGGPRKAADLLNNLQSSATERLLTELAQRDAVLADTIRENMFTFTDFIQLTSRDLQAVLREVSTEELVPALKAAPPELVDKILSNVSARAAEAIREDLESGQPVRRSEAEIAQKAILRRARALDADGVISISSSEDIL